MDSQSAPQDSHTFLQEHGLSLSVTYGVYNTYEFFPEPKPEIFLQYYH